VLLAVVDILRGADNRWVGKLRLPSRSDHAQPILGIPQQGSRRFLDAAEWVFRANVAADFGLNMTGLRDDGTDRSRYQNAAVHHRHGVTQIHPPDGQMHRVIHKSSSADRNLVWRLLSH
jgi:hypothetical protein